MIQLPLYQESVIFGLLLSEGWLSFATMSLKPQD
jgi:hypothetical protein